MENLAKGKFSRELRSQSRKTEMKSKWRHVIFVSYVQSTPAAVVQNTRTGMTAGYPFTVDFSQIAGKIKSKLSIDTNCYELQLNKDNHFAPAKEMSISILFKRWTDFYLYKEKIGHIIAEQGTDANAKPPTVKQDSWRCETNKSVFPDRRILFTANDNAL